MVYVTHDMAIRSRREFKMVLIPPWGIVVAFVSALPIPIALALLGQWNLAMLFVATTMLYVASYEWLHLSYHLPPESFVGRRRIIAFLRRHHATHHDPTLMQKWNFNVTIPLWDVVRGTVHREEKANRQRATGNRQRATGNRKRAMNRL
jgi:sterol desaturase/sphingolipid hydroxylase (fatty acid hydroxylase superfamily)